MWYFHLIIVRYADDYLLCSSHYEINLPVHVHSNILSTLYVDAVARLEWRRMFIFLKKKFTKFSKKTSHKNN